MVRDLVAWPRLVKLEGDQPRQAVLTSPAPLNCAIVPSFALRTVLGGTADNPRASLPAVPHDG